MNLSEFQINFDQKAQPISHHLPACSIWSFGSYHNGPHMLVKYSPVVMLP